MLLRIDLALFLVQSCTKRHETARTTRIERNETKRVLDAMGPDKVHANGVGALIQVVHN